MVGEATAAAMSGVATAGDSNSGGGGGEGGGGGSSPPVEVEAPKAPLSVVPKVEAVKAISSVVPKVEVTVTAALHLSVQRH